MSHYIGKEVTVVHVGRIVKIDTVEEDCVLYVDNSMNERESTMPWQNRVTNTRSTVGGSIGFWRKLYLAK